MNFKGSHVIHSLQLSQRTHIKKAILFLSTNRLLKGPTKVVGEALANKVKGNKWIGDDEWHSANSVIRQHAEDLANMANLGFFRL